MSPRAISNATARISRCFALPAASPGVSRRAPDYIRYASPYDHLARVKEWSAAPDLGDAGDEV